MLGPDGQELEVVRVEKMSDDAWGGVARVDRGDADTLGFGGVATLVAGDLAALLLFAAVGRMNHGEGLALGEVVATALPFLVGWFGAAPFLGGYSADARKKGVGAAAGTAAKCWAVAAPVGIALRSIARGYMPATSFILVSAGVTAVLLVGWRSALAAATPAAEPDSVKARKNKQGNPLEFIQLLMSLTKRW
ncbi:hypothetical protein HYH03_006706 [Edaphochlamys debaryana]|uniref:Uncharacterized protein n=1 Tax=Edaphochlamys debaryana TaxID=47281 RepID=A0A835YA03_9CHLO|nr:hypothetical protein HYH03_006706 [Edaphochlamys debaryana]|eukprot:KAG2495095.1 hypothetical protein HYH03_006706 [Edaphochlamys debaryana]